MSVGGVLFSAQTPPHSCKHFTKRVVAPGGWYGKYGVGPGFTPGPRTQAATAVFFSLEAQTLFVQGLYARFLGRTGNAQEISGWVQALNSGENQEQVFAQIAGSQEGITQQATGILIELASGAWSNSSLAAQRLQVQFGPGTSAAAVLDTLKWVDGTVTPGWPDSASGNSPVVVSVDVPARRTLASAAQLLQQNPNVQGVRADLTPVANLTSALTWLQVRSTAMIQASSITMSNGVTAFLPQVGTNYNGFWLRDFAYMLEGNIGAFTNQQLESAGQLFINSMRWDGAGVDSIGLDGTIFYEPNAGMQGANPVADGSPFTVDVAWRIFQQTHDVSFIARNLVALAKCIAAAPIDPSTAWRLTIYAQRYGFTDLVPKRGDDLSVRCS